MVIIIITKMTMIIYKGDGGDGIGVDSDQPIHSCEVERCLLPLEVAHLVNKTSSTFKSYSSLLASNLSPLRIHIKMTGHLGACALLEQNFSDLSFCRVKSLSVSILLLLTLLPLGLLLAAPM